MQANLADTKRVREIVERYSRLDLSPGRRLSSTLLSPTCGNLVNNIVGQVNILEAALALPTSP